jgi:cytochrome c biogenesis protein CcmG/thiol:disulfide interchange protein DsbE
VYGVPETFLIDQAGVIRKKQIGPITEKAWKEKLLPMIEELTSRPARTSS